MRQLLLAPNYGEYEFSWQAAYGMVYRIKGCFGQDRLMISDPVASQHIFNSPQFALGPKLDNIVHLLFGKDSVMGVNETTTTNASEA
ncbi:hypothetical protein C8R46DRAFT_1322452 [Mycena filopes]|nr:hypothetical protein C8R46DRAFT_1322452 [Mycena filopes]